MQVVQALLAALQTAPAPQAALRAPQEVLLQREQAPQALLEQEQVHQALERLAASELAVVLALLVRSTGDLPYWLPVETDVRSEILLLARTAVSKFGLGSLHLGLCWSSSA